MEQTDKPAAAYDSNPFTSTWSGIKKMWGLNKGSAIGVTLFNVLMFMIAGASLMAVLFATIIFIYQQNFDTTVTPFGDFSFFSYSNIYGTWIVGALLIILSFTLVGVLQLQLSAASARSQAVKFGSLFKGMWRYILPMLGLGSLALLAVIAAVLVMALLATVLGAITIVIGLIAVLLGVYATFRLAYAGYFIVDKQRGPVQALKDSWRLSSGHVVETIGAGSVSSLVIMVPSVVLTALARVTESMPGISSTFSILDIVASVLLVLFSAMALAERYVQLQTVADKKLPPAPLSPMNYLAIVLLIAIGGLLNVLTPESTITTDFQNTTDTTIQSDTFQQDTTDLPTSLN